MTTLGFVYSHSEVYQDIKGTVSNLFSKRPNRGLVMFKETVDKIGSKIFSNMCEYIMEAYRNPRYCCGYDLCEFHMLHPFLRDFYDTRPDADLKWVTNRCIKIKIMYLKDDIKNHPRKSLICLISIIYSITFFPNLSGLLLMVYAALELASLAYNIFDQSSKSSLDKSNNSEDISEGSIETSPSPSAIHCSSLSPKSSGVVEPSMIKCEQ